MEGNLYLPVPGASFIQVADFAVKARVGHSEQIFEVLLTLQIVDIYRQCGDLTCG